MNCSTGHAFQSSETIHRIVDLNKDTTCSLAPLWPPSKMHQQIHLAFDFTSEISCRTFWFWSLLLQNFADIVLFSSQSQQQLSTVCFSNTEWGPTTPAQHRPPPGYPQGYFSACPRLKEYFRDRTGGCLTLCEIFIVRGRDPVVSCVTCKVEDRIAVSSKWEQSVLHSLANIGCEIKSQPKQIKINQLLGTLKVLTESTIGLGRKSRTQKFTQKTIMVSSCRTGLWNVLKAALEGNFMIWTFSLFW